MNRRQLLIGVTGITTGSLSLGTGAFTSTSVERGTTIPITSDVDAAVGLVPNPDVVGVHIADSKFTIDLEDPGINVNSTYQFGFFEDGLNDDYLEEFPLKAESDEPAEDLSDGQDGDAFKSAFAVVNQSSSKKRLKFVLDLNDNGIEDTKCAFEIHRENDRIGLVEPGSTYNAVEEFLDPGEAFGVSFIIQSGDTDLGEELTGSMRIEANAAH